MSYGAFVAARGVCSGCGTTFNVDVFPARSGFEVSCRSCHLLKEDARRLGITISDYSVQRKIIIEEMTERIAGKERKFTKDRNSGIYSMFLMGRSYAHIGDLYGLSRERVRQIIKKIRKSL